MSEIYINCRELTKSFGSRSLFQNLSFSIFSKDRVGLIGPNGSGKTTLLKILAKEELPNTGEISIKRGLKIGYVPQVCTFGDQTLFEALLEGFAEDDLRADYEKEQIIRYWLSKMGFKEFQGRASALSGGWRKRLSIAKELLKEPDLLLLDEPTNHLDLEGILWLEEFFRKESISFVLVSHDRYFLQNMVNRIIEINPVYPQGLFETSGSYAEFLERKEQFLQGQLRQERSIATQVRKESNWLHTSPKARTCKSKSRVEDAYEILDDFSQIQMRNTEKKAKIDFLATDRETQKLLTAKNISKEIGGRPLFCHLDFILSPGKKIGLMGPNGSGKTTLLKMIAGEMAPDQGTIKRADALQIVYFDQHRAQ
ncbi:MAG: ABC-F family ATP-binding cassette domain-containing protein, partial [Chlamydiales bacterium]|nr:ABC-F family ATP-binding cassette domain-containing protein [Chlamydiales bacterium]